MKKLFLLLVLYLSLLYYFTRQLTKSSEELSYSKETELTSIFSITPVIQCSLEFSNTGIREAKIKHIPPHIGMVFENCQKSPELN